VVLEHSLKGRRFFYLYRDSNEREEEQMAKKIKVYVEPNETIDECLNRIAQMGYRPVRRIEKPVFEQTGTKDEPVHSHQSILFECVTLES
jgi:esterase/lipase